MPIHRNSQLLDRTSVEALHDNFSLFVFCLPSVAEPAANSCFHEQERTVLGMQVEVLRAVDNFFVLRVLIWQERSDRRS